MPITPQDLLNKDVLSSRANIAVVLQSLRKGEAEQVLIERTLGRAVLAKLSGKAANLNDIYKEIGGIDPVAQIMFSEAAEAFDKLPVLPGVQATRATAISQEVGLAAAGKGSQLERNSLVTVPNQALNILGELGGAEFAAKYSIQR